jgi:enoyl-CoA hydratase/carnithine racemase
VDTLCEIHNRIAFITLNRPASLNALTMQMIGELSELLHRFIKDPGVHAVLIQGAGEKAFCAGGDIRALYDSYKEGSESSLYTDFFAAEYPLDYLLRFYPKPYIAQINGIVMGGGMGVAQGSRLRLVGERTRMAMPEVGIGFFPDVGASFFLSRLPGQLGRYLALTGAQIRAADTLYVGLADFYLPNEGMQALPERLKALKWQGSDPESWRETLLREIGDLSAPAPPAPLAQVREAIDEHFAHDSVLKIASSLGKETRPQYAQWAADSLKLLSTRSPTMLAVTIEQLKRGREMDFAQCLRMEIGMARQCFDQGDFIEGVRALVIDKDNAPHWKPARNEDVTAAQVEFIFQDPWQGKTHPLMRMGQL